MTQMELQLRSCYGGVVHLTHHQMQEELTQLLGRFRALEEQGATTLEAPEGLLVVIRLDGIKHSKRFLKSTLVHPQYRQATHEALVSLHRLYRHWGPPDAPAYLRGALSLSDEVSVVVGRGPNYYRRKMLKMVTSLVATLSGAMSLAYAQAGEYEGPPPIMGFDGRGILLVSSQDLLGYIRLRRLLFLRNAMAKVLRLCSPLPDEQIYQGDFALRNDLVKLGQAIEQYQLWPQVEEAASGACFYEHTHESRWVGHGLGSDPGTPGLLESRVQAW